jgi:N6-adenosine-specific RNA methylase IME4
MNMKFHPAADAFPMMDEKRYAELVEDIKTNGQREPITVCDGMILDGRNRYTACMEIGKQPITREFTGDPWAYAWSLNGMRRDLVAEQRYLIWRFCSDNSEKLQAEKKRIEQEANRKRAEAAKAQENRGNRYTAKKEPTLEVGVHSVQPPLKKQPKQRQAIAELSKTNNGAVARGDILIKERPDLAKAVMQGTIRPADAHRELKREAHAKKVEQSQSVPDKVNITGPYDLVMADPPWRYDHQKAKNREIENHYCTATTEDIISHKPETKDNAILFLWATAPKLREAMAVMEGWGFEYVTHAIWDKKKIGMGYWFRGRHELLLVGTKGKPGSTPECERVSSIFEEPRGNHSAKPLCVYEWVERAFPDKTKLEMYCRTPRSGWAAWGNEI